MNIITKKNKSKDYILIDILKNKIDLLDKDEKVEQKVLITVVGIDLLGNRKIIGMSLERESDNRYYLDLMEEIKGCGINNIYFMACSLDSNIKRAIKISYPNTICINSFTNIFLSLWSNFNLIDRKTLKQEIKNLFVSNSYDDYLICLNDFRQKNNSKLMNMICDKYFGNLKDFYNYGKALRDFLSNDYPFSYINDRIRLLNKKNNVVNYNDFLDIIKSTMIDFENVKPYNKNNWINVIDDASEFFPDVIEKVGSLL